MINAEFNMSKALHKLSLEINKSGSDSGISCTSRKSGGFSDFDTSVDTSMSTTPDDNFVITINNGGRLVNSNKFTMPPQEEPSSDSSTDEEEDSSDMDDKSYEEEDLESNAELGCWILPKMNFYNCDIITSHDSIFNLGKTHDNKGDEIEEEMPTDNADNEDQIDYHCTFNGVNNHNNSVMEEFKVPTLQNLPPPKKTSKYGDDDCLSLYPDSEFDFNDAISYFPSTSKQKITILDDRTLHNPRRSLNEIMRGARFCLKACCRCCDIHLDLTAITKEIAEQPHDKQRFYWSLCNANENILPILASSFSIAVCQSNNFVLLQTMVEDIMASFAIYDKVPVIETILKSLEKTAHYSFSSAVLFIAKPLRYSKAICDVLLTVVLKEVEFLQHWSQIAVLLNHCTHPIDTFIFEMILNEACADYVTVGILQQLKDLLEDFQFVDSNALASCTKDRFKHLIKNKIPSPTKSVKIKNGSLKPSDFVLNPQIFTNLIKTHYQHPKSITKTVVSKIGALSSIDFDKFLCTFKTTTTILLKDGRQYERILKVLTFSILPELYQRKQFESGAIIMKMFWTNITDFASISCFTDKLRFKKILRTGPERLVFILKFFTRSSEIHSAIELIQNPELQLNDRSNQKLYDVKVTLIEQFLRKLFSQNKLDELYTLMCFLIDTYKDANTLKGSFKIWQYFNAFFDQVGTLCDKRSRNVLEYTPTLFKYFHNLDTALQKNIVLLFYRAKLDMEKLVYLLDSQQQVLYPQAPDCVVVYDFYVITEIQLCLHVFFYKMLLSNRAPLSVNISVRSKGNSTPISVCIVKNDWQDFESRLVCALKTFSVYSTNPSDRLLTIDQQNCKIILEKLRKDLSFPSN